MFPKREQDVPGRAEYKCSAANRDSRVVRAADWATWCHMHSSRAEATVILDVWAEGARCTPRMKVRPPALLTDLKQKSNSLFRLLERKFENPCRKRIDHEAGNIIIENCWVVSASNPAFQLNPFSFSCPSVSLSSQRFWGKKCLFPRRKGDLCKGHWWFAV